MKTNVHIPTTIMALPRDAKGYPIPFFVAEPEPGKQADLRIASETKKRRCFKERLCWVCGVRLDYWMTFIGGPLACSNRVFSDVRPVTKRLRTKT